MGASASSNKPIAPSEVLSNFGVVSSVKGSSPFEIRWSIRDFPYHCKNTKCMQSPPFASEDGALWVMVMYPTGHPHKLKNFVTVYLIALNKMDFHCITSTGEFRCKVGAVYPKVVSTNYLIEMLNDKDELIIICRVKCVDRNTPKYFINVNMQLSHSTKTSTLELLGDFGELLNNSELSDVDLLAADGKVFKVHKAVLAARSKVFLAMFKNDMLEHQTSIVKVEDISGSVLEQVLKFIYTANSEITDVNAKDVLLAAHKYDIGALETECIDHLRISINIKNAIEQLEFAERYDVRDLKVEAQLFIAKNAKEITQQPDFDLASLNAEAVNQLFRKMATISK